MKNGLEIGLYTLGDYLADPHTQKSVTPQERVKQIVELAQLAEQAGFDIFQVGESHQPHFVSQGHLVLLGAIAQATKTIRLASGATILSANDPVRVYEDSATIDLLSNGRMEILAGRSYRLGIYDTLNYPLEDYEARFEENFELLKLINQREIVNWSGEYRAPLNNVTVLPRALQKDGLPIWRAISGSLESAKVAGTKGDAIYVMYWSGELARYQALIDQYREAADYEGIDASQLSIATAGYLFTRPDTQKALDQYYPYVSQGARIVNDYEIERSQFDKAASADSLFNVGSPELLVEKLLKQHEVLKNNRYVGQIDFGGMPFDEVKRTIDLLGDKVLPEVKEYAK